MQAQFQGSVHSSALFPTAAAQNLLCMKLASELGVAIASPWVTWFTAALAPALVGLLVTPLIMYKASTRRRVPSCVTQTLCESDRDRCLLACAVGHLVDRCPGACPGRPTRDDAHHVQGADMPVALRHLPCDGATWHFRHPKRIAEVALVWCSCYGGVHLMSSKEAPEKVVGAAARVKAVRVSMPLLAAVPACFVRHHGGAARGNGVGGVSVGLAA